MLFASGIKPSDKSMDHIRIPVASRNEDLAECVVADLLRGNGPRGLPPPFPGIRMAGIPQNYGEFPRIFPRRKDHI